MDTALAVRFHRVSKALAIGLAVYVIQVFFSAWWLRATDMARSNGYGER